METKRKKVILDVDTGSDDAVAIISAILCEELEVLGIIASHGNQPLPYTLANTLRVVEMLGSDVPVFGGCGQPMVQYLSPGRTVNAAHKELEKEIGGKVVAIHEKALPLPGPTIQAQKEHGCTWLLETLQNTKEKITIIPVGPMTNLGMVLRMDPTVANKIEEVVLMGGGVYIKNTTKCAEINFYNDPEAAKILLTSGIPITIVPLDATHSSWFGYPEAKKMMELGNPTAKFAGEMLKHRIDTALELGVRKEPMSALHDVLAVCAAIDKSVLEELSLCSCDVDVSGGVADGQLVVDTRPVAEYKYPTYVALKGNTEKLFQMLYSHLQNYGKASQQKR